TYIFLCGTGKLAGVLRRVFSQNIDFDVHRISGLKRGEIGVFPGMGDQHDFDVTIFHAIDREADAVQSDRTLFYTIISELLGEAESRRMALARILSAHEPSQS